MEAVGRVQELASSAIHDLPEKFVRLPHEQPINSKAVDGIKVPVISLSRPRDALVDDIKRACNEWGFFLATDHGISNTLIERLKRVGIEFFDLPRVEKEKLANDPSVGRFEGYGTKMTKNHDEKVEWVDYYFHILSPPSKVMHERWPNHRPSYKEVTEEYGREMLRVTQELLEIMSEGLDVEKKALWTCLGGDKIELEMKINFYPPCPQPQLALGVEAHTDMSGLTILVPNDVPGLQVWKDGHWVAVDYIPNALFVHVGDQIEVLSNGKYKSVLHRSLVNKEKIRMSWAVFSAPPPEAVIGPMPEVVEGEGKVNQPKYKTRTFAEYRHCKFNKLPLD